MYRVVGCGDCSALWIIDGRPGTTECPRCGRRHRFEQLRALAEAGSKADAREARARLLAERSDHGEAFADVAAYDELESELEDVGVSDEEYLAGSGIDPETIADAAERESGGPGGRREVVRTALRELDAPDETDVVEFAASRDVSPEDARNVLERLVRSGEAVEADGGYRLV